MVQVDWVVGAGCEEDLGGWVLEGEVGARGNGAGRLGEGERGVGGESYGGLARFE